jgi:hypothetical protein
MLFDPPIGGGANNFLWIVFILVGFIVAVSQNDVFFGGKKKKKEKH